MLAKNKLSRLLIVLVCSIVMSALLITPVRTASSYPQQDSQHTVAARNADDPSPRAALATGTPSYLPVIQREWPYESIFGVGLDNAGGLPLLASSKSTWTRRFGLYWSKVEAAEGVRNWSVMAGFEQELLSAAQKNIRMILIVGSTPSWAQAASGALCGPIKQSKLAAFGVFMAEAVIRYSKSPYNVKYWELWNEPDIATGLVPGDSEFGCWGNASDPYYGGGYYAEMLKAVYPPMKAADPSVRVMIGGLLLDCDPRLNPPPPGKSCLPSNFLAGIVRAGGGNYFDGISFHAYDFYEHALGKYSNINWNATWNTSGPVGSTKSQFIRQILSEYNVSGKFLINTEVGIIIWAGTAGDPTFESTKAYYAAQSYAAAIADNLRGNLWYSLGGWFGSDMLDGSGNPRPVFTAYKFASEQLGSARFIGTLSSADVGGNPGVAGYKFNRDGTNVWVVWSRGGSNKSVTLPSVPTTVYDALGAAQPGSPSANLTVGIAPLYLEWKP